MPAIPPRVGTAPTTADGKGRLPPSLADFRAGAVPLRQPPPAGLPRAPPAAAGSGGSGLPAKLPAATGGSSPAPEAPAAATATATATTAAPTSKGSSPPLRAAEADAYPEDCMYDIAHFIALKQSMKPISDYIMEYASNLWKLMPEHLDSLSNNSLRDSLFKEENATMPSKVLVDRKLHNEVLGILGKVTDNNIERMKRELTDLPIRQSTKEEIGEVINTFFRKCVRPEDSRYTPLYVQLIKHLISTIGEGEPAGYMIRRQIIFKCRDTFIHATDTTKELEDRIANLTEEEANLERMIYAAKQKANVQFLGLLFVESITSENVVLSVLENLLYGESKKRRFVPDYCLVHFMELLQTCGPHLSRGCYETALPSYIRTLVELKRTYPQKRIVFLIENFLEAMGNNWVPLHGKGAQPPGSQPRPSAGHSGQPNAAPPGFTIVIPEAKERIPDREEFWKVMDDFFTTNEVDEIKGLIETIPVEVQIVYMSKWIGRYITTYKYATERSRLGELFEQLATKGIVTVATAQAALTMHVKLAIDEDLFTDQPKYFSHWASVIKNGRSVFPLSLHTKLLDMLVSAHVSMPIIIKMITAVNGALDDAAAKAEQKEYNPQERFRVLQALLRYTPPLLFRPPAGEPDLESNEYLDENGNKLDIISAVAQKGIDAEVTLFKVLCDRYHEEKKSAVLAAATDELKTNHNMAYPLFSALFTFVRYDVDALCTSHRDVLKKLCSTRPLTNLLEDAYVQWTRLGGADAHYTHFVRRVVSICGTGKSDPIDKLKERLRVEYHCEKLIFLLEKAMKN